MKVYVLNAFSLSMITPGDRVCTMPATPAEVSRIVRSGMIPPHLVAEDRARAAEVISVVGHESTAKIFSDALGVPVAFRRESVKIARGDCALVGQYVGPRLPEGSTALPEGAEIRWIFAEIR